MSAGDITFIECPYGDSFPVRKTATRSSGVQQIICPRCGHSFDVMLPESVERLSREVTTPPVTGETIRHIGG
jgi:transposase-like protein